MNNINEIVDFLYALANQHGECIVHLDGAKRFSRTVCIDAAKALIEMSNNGEKEND